MSSETVEEDGSPDDEDRSPDDEDRSPAPLAFLPLHGRALQVARWVAVVVAIYVLISAVAAIGSGFELATGDRAEELFAFASNPFVGLFVGILATVLTQSSSTTTSIVVGLVAGGLPISIAVPILLGANVGTTVTSTLVSLGAARERETFRRAFGAASVHDLYNLTAVAIFLPAELAFGLLERASGWLTGQGEGSDGGGLATGVEAFGDAVSAVTSPGADLLEAAVSPLPDVWAGVLLTLVGIALILAVISFIARMLGALLVGRAERIFHRALGRGPLSGIAAGTVITLMVQSSSTTTSLAVPLAASGKFSLKQVYPYTVGANMGTTATAVIAAFAFTGAEGQAGLQAAFVHLLYNVFAAIVVFGTPLRPLPLLGARRLGDLGARSTGFVAAWVLGVFLVLPAGLMAISIWW